MSRQAAKLTIPPKYPKDQPQPETLPKASGFANSERKAELSETPALNAVLEMTMRKTADSRHHGQPETFIRFCICQCTDHRNDSDGQQVRKRDRQRPSKCCPNGIFRDDRNKKRVVNGRQNDGCVAGVGKIVGRPSKNLPLGDAGHKQVLSGIH